MTSRKGALLPTPSLLSSSQAAVPLLPDDAHNRALVESVHPPDWVNPVPAERYNLVVVGAGTAGLVSAVGAASLGARVAIVERHLMGGDCLNFGCVPSKSLLRAARAVQAVREAEAFGSRAGGLVEFDFGAAPTAANSALISCRCTNSATTRSEPMAVA